MLHTWEAGTRFPSLSDFLRLARLAGHDENDVLARFRGGSDRGGYSLGTRAGQAAWLLGLSERRPASELARALGRNRNTVARWLDGKTQPRLPDLLHYIEITSKRSLEFLAAFADPAELPSLSARFRDLELQHQLAYGMPWAHAVLRALETTEYRRLRRHQPGVIAAMIGVEQAVEGECLAALHRARQIRRVRGKWRVRRVLSVDTRADPEGNRHVKQHWARVALNRLPELDAAGRGRFSYNLFAVSEQSLAEIEALHLNYYERLRQVVEECSDPSQVVLVNVQLCPLAAIKRGGVDRS